MPPPEDLPSEAELKAVFLKDAPEAVRRYWERERPIELRPVDLRHYVSRERLDPAQQVWVRATGKLPDDPDIHRCVLAYASDMTLLDTALFAHGRAIFDRDLQAASLDHALWFHRPFRADEWLLYAEDSPSASGARGFNRGSLFSRDGRLVASVAQEGLIRAPLSACCLIPGDSAQDRANSEFCLILDAAIWHACGQSLLRRRIACTYSSRLRRPIAIGTELDSLRAGQGRRPLAPPGSSRFHAGIRARVKSEWRTNTGTTP